MAKAPKTPKAKVAPKVAEVTDDVEDKVEATPPPKILLSDVKAGSLVNQIHKDTVEFYHDGELFEVDVMFKTLPFVESDDLHNRMNEKEDVAAEWISKTLVDEKGELQFTQEQVENNFIQPLANAVFNKVWGLDNIKKAMERHAPKPKKE